MATHILGISCFYHDAAACLLRDGEVVAAASEERFTRKKHDADFPLNAVRYCLEAGGIETADLDHVGFYDKPFTKFERIIETYLAVAPRGIQSWVMAIPLWLKEKIFMRKTIQKKLDGYEGDILFSEHHESHAASAFYCSPFEEAAILTLDGVGEWATAAKGIGRGEEITLTHEIHFPHSLGLLYTAFTYYLGFKVNSGEYKVMGLAPYGKPVYFDLIMDRLIDVKADGSFKLNMDYFAYTHKLTMINKKFNDLFGGPPRTPETWLNQREFDIAASIQRVTEEVVLRLCRSLHAETGLDNLCLAGGVALNCVANGKIIKQTPFKDIYVQPAAGDAGGAVGVAQLISPLPGPGAKTPAAGRLPGSGILERGDQGLPGGERCALSRVGPGNAGERRCPAHRREERDWLVSGPDGVWPAGPGRPEHPGRRPRPRDAQHRQ